MIMNTFGCRKGNINDPKKSENALIGKNYRFKQSRCFTWTGGAPETPNPRSFPGSLTSA